MATGYTHPVVDGTVTEFPEFAMQCARAFGALVTMRDSPMDAPIPDEIEPSSYSAKKLAEATAKLAKLKAMTPAKIQQKADESYAVLLKSHLDYRAKMKLENDRLDAMIGHVKAWRPPTPDHKGIKEFMLEQLTSSKHDMKWGSEEPVKKSAEAWLAAELASVERDIAYHFKQDSEEKKRARDRTEWIQKLRASLKQDAMA